MGKAVAYLPGDRPANARATFTHLIEMLGRTLAPDDPTGQGVLSGAYANRGILHDRLGRYEPRWRTTSRRWRSTRARSRAGAVPPHPLRQHAPGDGGDRADYLRRQLALPKSERLLRMPELDTRQRMYKP